MEAVRSSETVLNVLLDYTESPTNNTLNSHRWENLKSKIEFVDQMHKY
jgi:hypothetical protein